MNKRINPLVEFRSPSLAKVSQGSDYYSTTLNLFEKAQSLSAGSLTGFIDFKIVCAIWNSGISSHGGFRRSHCSYRGHIRSKKRIDREVTKSESTMVDDISGRGGFPRGRAAISTREEDGGSSKLASRFGREGTLSELSRYGAEAIIFAAK